MSQNSQVTRFVIAMVGALVVVTATWKVRHVSDATRAGATRKQPTRNVASIRADAAKKARFQQVEMGTEGKVSGSFTVRVTGDDGAGGALEALPSPASRVRLRGVVRADRRTPAQEFSWIFPPTYKTVSGAANGSIPELQAGQSHEVTIMIDRGSEVVQPIVFHVFKIINSEPRGQVTQFDIPNPTSVKPTAENSATRLKTETFIQ